MEDLKYIEETHEYFLGDKKLSSVTELAKQFAKMDTAWLEAHPEFAEKGTLIHNELAEYFHGEKEQDELSEVAGALASWVGRVPTTQSEVLVYNKEHEYAGTADIVSIHDKKCTLIADFKTGEHINKKYCACQLSLYLLAVQSMGVDVEGVKLAVINPTGVHYFEPLSWEDMVAMGKDDLVPNETTLDSISKIEKELSELEVYVERYEQAKNELKDLLIKAFVKKKASKYTGEYYAYTYAPATTRKTFDTAKAKELLGEKADDLMKESSVSETVRFKKLGA